MTLGALATLPGVVGIKIADELGYHDGMGNDPTRIQTFLADAAATLHRVAPGKLLLVDMIVPQLGCAPGLPSVAALSATCAARAAALYPALTLARVDRYVRSSDISVLDLSTGLLDPSIYLSWGIDRATAQRAAWAEVARRGWGRHVRLQARKALAHPGAYDSSRAIANTDLHDFVDIPLDMGAQAVDIWTWRQTYKGAVVRLMNPGLTTNPLWQGLVERRRRGARLFTHFTPSSTERGARVDLRTLSQAFTDVFMAAGIG